MKADRPGMPFSPARGVSQLMYVGDDGQPAAPSALVVVGAVVAGIVLVDLLLTRPKRR